VFLLISNTARYLSPNLNSERGYFIECFGPMQTWKHLFFTWHEFSLETNWACRARAQALRSSSEDSWSTIRVAACHLMVLGLLSLPYTPPLIRPGVLQHLAELPLRWARQKAHHSFEKMELTCLPMQTSGQGLWAAMLCGWKSSMCSAGLWFAQIKVEHIVCAASEAAERENVEGW